MKLSVEYITTLLKNSFIIKMYFLGKLYPLYYENFLHTHCGYSIDNKECFAVILIQNVKFISHS
jgi:hypothetical protein